MAGYERDGWRRVGALSEFDLGCTKLNDGCEPSHAHRLQPADSPRVPAYALAMFMTDTQNTRAAPTQIPNTGPNTTRWINAKRTAKIKW